MSVLFLNENESLLGVLSQQILQRWPRFVERPQYDRIVRMLQKELAQSVKPCTVLRAPSGSRAKFDQALVSFGYRLFYAEQQAGIHGFCSPDAPEVVDHCLHHLVRNSSADWIAVLSHDHAIAAALRDKKERGSRIAVVGFPEFLASDLLRVADRVFDVERDLDGFNCTLPRLEFSHLKNPDPFAGPQQSSRY